MRVRKGWAGGWYVVFEDNTAADRWEWLFWGVFRRIRICFGSYDNAYLIF